MTTQIVTSNAARAVTANNRRKSTKEQGAVGEPRKTIKANGWRRKYERTMEIFKGCATLRLVSVGPKTHPLTTEAYRAFAAMRAALVRGYSAFDKMYRQAVDKNGNITGSKKFSEFIKLLPCYKLRRTGFSLFDLDICPRIELGAEYLRMTNRAHLPTAEKKNIMRAARKGVWELYHFYAECSYKDKNGRTKTETFPIIMHDDRNTPPDENEKIVLRDDRNTPPDENEKIVLHDICFGLRFHPMYAQLLVTTGRITNVDEYFWKTSSVITMTLLEQLCERYTNIGAQNDANRNDRLKVATILDALPIPTEREVLKGRQSRDHIIWRPLVNSLKELKENGVIDYHFTLPNGKKITDAEAEQMPWGERLPKYDFEKCAYSRSKDGLRLEFSIPSLADELKRVAKKAQQKQARAEAMRARTENARADQLGKMKAKNDFKNEQTQPPKS